MKISVICAMEEEIKLLSDKMQNVSKRTLQGVEITNGRIDTREVNLCICGVGKANAAATAQLNISELKCDAILNIGLAGNCSRLSLGGAVVANKLVYHDYNMAWAAESAPFTEFFTPNKTLSDKARSALDKLSIEYIDGTVASGDQFISDNHVKADIIARTGCKCVEMEGAAIAHIAQKCDVPYAIIKVISDNADEGGSDGFHETISLGGYCKESSEIIAEIVNSL